MATFTKSTSGYDPYKDSIHTPKEKIAKCFNSYQMKLATRPDVTKSLLKALCKVFIFKKDFDSLCDRWIGESTDKLIKSIPLITK